MSVFDHEKKHNQHVD